METMEEAFINVRRDKYEGVLKKFTKEHTQKGVQTSNLDPAELKGLKSLLKRTKANEIAVCLTDKSGKLCVTGREEYLKMGQTHTSKDKLVTMKEVAKCAEYLDCHTSMLIKITGVGDSWGHYARMRESLLGGQCPAPMYLMVKDHKALGPEGTPKTRPVVSGHLSYTTGLSEILSDMIESVYVSLNNKTGVISTDDLLARFKKLKSTMMKHDISVKTRGEVRPSNYDGNNICLLATDVEALFPSLNAQEASLICKEVIQGSQVTFEGVRLEEALLYISLNRDGMEEDDIKVLEPNLPTRRRMGGNNPTIKNALVKGPKLISEWKEGETKWRHPVVPTSKAIHRLVMAMVIQIGVRELFKNFCYTFGGNKYQQLEGGPIGDRLTMCVSLLVMEWTWTKLRHTITNSDWSGRPKPNTVTTPPCGAEDDLDPAKNLDVTLDQMQAWISRTNY